MSRMNLMIPILAILIATIFLPDVSFCLKYETASSDVLSRPMIQEFHSALDSGGFSLTWASNWNFEFQPVYNNTILIGDHVVLNVTFNEEILGMNLTSSRLVMIDEFGSTLNKTVSGNYIILDTYYLSKNNATYDIMAIGYNLENEFIVCTRDAVTICNFFIPELLVYVPVVLPEDSLTLNLSWSCTDKNAGEMNFFEIGLSNDGGMSYYILVRNLTVYWYIWNSSGFFQTTYLFRIRAYSHDVLQSYPLDRIPNDYWPGDFKDGIVQHEAGDVHTGEPPSPSPPEPLPILSHPSDIHYYQGDVGNQIVWDVTSVHSFEYHILRNNTIIVTDTWSDGPIIVSVDGLVPGVYQYRIIIGYYAEDRVLVFVEVGSGPVILLGFALLIFAFAILNLRYSERVRIIE